LRAWALLLNELSVCRTTCMLNELAPWTDRSCHQGSPDHASAIAWTFRHRLWLNTRIGQSGDSRAKTGSFPCRSCRRRLVDYTLAWSATADYGWLNGGGKHPSAANKAGTSASGASNFAESPKHGRVMATVPVANTPPPSPTTLSCGTRQTEVLADVSYSDTLTDTTNNVSTSLSASATFFNFGK
jgi:hypothetical protein